MMFSDTDVALYASVANYGPEEQQFYQKLFTNHKTTESTMPASSAGLIFRKTNLDNEFLKQTWKVTCTNCKDIDLRQFMLFAKYCAVQQCSRPFNRDSFSSPCPLLTFTDASLEGLKSQIISNPGTSNQQVSAPYTPSPYTPSPYTASPYTPSPYTPSPYLSSSQTQQPTTTAFSSLNQSIPSAFKSEGPPSNPPPQQDSPFDTNHLAQAKEQWNRIEKKEHALLSKAEGGKLLKESALPMPELKKIWLLVDTQERSKLNEQEFVVCLHLLENRKKGLPIPDKLPADLLEYIETGIYKKTNAAPDKKAGNVTQVPSISNNPMQNNDLIKAFEKFKADAEYIAKQNTEKVNQMRETNKKALENEQKDLEFVKSLVDKLKTVYPALVKENENLQKELENLRRAKQESKGKITDKVALVCKQSTEAIKNSLTKITDLEKSAAQLKDSLNSSQMDKERLSSENLRLTKEVETLKSAQMSVNFSMSQDDGFDKIGESMAPALHTSAKQSAPVQDRPTEPVVEEKDDFFNDEPKDQTEPFVEEKDDFFDDEPQPQTEPVVEEKDDFFEDEPQAQKGDFTKKEQSQTLDAEQDDFFAVESYVEETELNKPQETNEDIPLPSISEEIFGQKKEDITEDDQPIEEHKEQKSEEPKVEESKAVNGSDSDDDDLADFVNKGNV